MNHHFSEQHFEEFVDEIDDRSSVITATTETVLEKSKDFMLPTDKIIIWVASNIATNLSYTVAVSTLSMNVRQKYFGPMISLGEDPIEICGEGDCLTLSHFHVNRMSENGIKPLALDVVIHSPD